MKNHLFFCAEFALVSLLFALPPMLRGEAQGELRFSAASLLLLPLGAAIYLLCKSHDFCGIHAPRYRQLSCGTVAFGCLALSGGTFQLLARVLSMGSEVRLAYGGILSHALAVLCLACGSFYEESLYRLYLPCGLKRLLPQRFMRMRFAPLSAEALCVLAFALSHRYMGLIAAANALCCGAALRLCAIRSGSIFPGAAAHFLYNAGAYVVAVCAG